MGMVVAWLLATYLGSAAVPGSLARHLASQSELSGVPLAFAMEPAGSLAVQFHERADWRLAHHQPAAPGSPAVLLVFAPAYLDGLAWRPLSRLTVDAAEYLFHALLGAHLDELAAGPGADRLAGMAEAAMGDVPAPHRLTAYLDALASFGSHLLSLRHEVARKTSRAGPDSAVCRALRQRHPFFRSWETAFSAATFPGSWDPGGGGRALAYSRGSLGREDRRWLVGEVLGQAWRGDLDAELGPVVCGARDAPPD